MRILHVYKDYAPVVGGIENHLRMLAEGQAARGHDVAVLVTSLDNRTHVERIGGVRVIYAARLATLSSTPVSSALFRLLDRERPDIIHLHFPYPWGEAANHLFGHAHRTVMTYHSDIVRQRFLRMVYGPLLNRVLSKVDALIATSPNYVKTSPVLERWRSKCVVVPLGIDPTPFMFASPVLHAPPGPGEKGYGSAGDTGKMAGTLLFVGRLRYYKGLGYLLRAMTGLPTARLIIVGTGPMEKAWRLLTAELRIANRVSFLGEVSGSELPILYRECELFVLPCSERSEAFGVVQLEAMASGKPVVSCDVGTGVAWVNQNDVTGLIVPPRDPNALSAAIGRLLRDKRLAERMGAAGRDRVLAEFTGEKMVERVMRVYESAG